MVSEGAERYSAQSVYLASSHGIYCLLEEGRAQGLEEVSWGGDAERVQEVGSHTVFAEDPGGASGATAKRDRLTVPRVAPATCSPTAI